MAMTRREICCEIGQRFFFPFAWLIFALVDYFVYVVPFATLGAICCIIYNDEFMYRHKMKFLMPQLCFWAFGFLLVLRKVCELKRKPDSMKKREEDLYDMDFEHVEEGPHYPITNTLNILKFTKNLFRNPYEFCKFRPAYGMYLLTVFIYFAVMVFYYNIAEIPYRKDDPYRTAHAVLLCPTMLLLVAVFGLSNTGLYANLPAQGYYEPFHEYVWIPRTVFIRKATAIFISAGKTHAVFSLFVALLILLCIASADFIWTAPSNEVLMTLLGFTYEPQSVVLAVLAAAVLSCAVILIGMVISTFVQVKRNILGTIEKNFERNMVAIRFLLQDFETDNLKDLKNALYDKIPDELTGDISLTKHEKEAFRYIFEPIWMSKQPFGGRWRKPVPDGDDSAIRPDEDLSPKQPVPKDPVLVEQEDKGYVEEADTERAEEETGDLQQESEALQKESEGYRLRQRRPKEAEPSTLEDTPAGTVKSRRRNL